MTKILPAKELALREEEQAPFDARVPLRYRAGFLGWCARRART